MKKKITNLLLFFFVFCRTLFSFFFFFPFFMLLWMRGICHLQVPVCRPYNGCKILKRYCKPPEESHNCGTHLGWMVVITVEATCAPHWELWVNHQFGGRVANQPDPFQWQLSLSLTVPLGSCGPLGKWPLSLDKNSLEAFHLFNNYLQ